MENSRNLSDYPYQNLILYGPPGTGKTYLAKNYALAAVRNVAPQALQVLSRPEVTQAYQQLSATGQIQFVTFHQSFSYEDFIEGIKPDLENDRPDLRYVLRDGIFKRMCMQATYAICRALHLTPTPGPTAEAPRRRKLSFQELYVEFLAEQINLLKRRVDVSYPSKLGREVVLQSVNGRGNLLLTTGRHGHAYVVTRQKLQRLYEAFPQVEDIRKVSTDIYPVIGSGNASLYWTVLNELKEFEKTLEIGSGVNQDTEGQRAKAEAAETPTYEQMARIAQVLDWSLVTPEVLARAERYALVIDEINRGNVSQIFGELITLIEPDKRGSRSEAISVRLPYSKFTFTVPPNLYIIGTMNTADRSVETLDTALRRRFTFVEMQPDYALLREKFGSDARPDLARMLETMNRRIARLLGREYAIGHAYLMDLPTAEAIADLKSVFANRLLPLLQEYFFGNAEKIALVIGEDFFTHPDERPDAQPSFFAASRYEVHEDAAPYGSINLRNIALIPDDAFRRAVERIYQ